MNSGRWWAHRDTTGATLLPARACHDTRHRGARQVRRSARSKHSTREQGRSSWGVPDTGSLLTGEHRGAVCTEATRPASGPFCRGADRLCGLGSCPGKRPLQHPVTGAVALWALASRRAQVVALASKALGERGAEGGCGAAARCSRAPQSGIDTRCQEACSAHVMALPSDFICVAVLCQKVTLRPALGHGPRHRIPAGLSVLFQQDELGSSGISASRWSWRGARGLCAPPVGLFKGEAVLGIEEGGCFLLEFLLCQLRLIFGVRALLGGRREP